jgi:hypothetical protein
MNVTNVAPQLTMEWKRERDASQWSLGTVMNHTEEIQHRRGTDGLAQDPMHGAGKVDEGIGTAL